MGGQSGAGGRVTSLAHGEQPESVQLLVHDLRQPVAAMCLLLTAIRGRGDVPDAVAADLHQLGRYTSQLWALLSEPTLAPSPPVRRPSASRRPVAAQRRAPPGAPIALDALAGDIAAGFGVLGPTRLVVECSQPVWVNAGETSLRRALNNVVDNACRAAGPGGTVRLRVGEDNGCGFVQVDDDGPGFGQVAGGTQLGLLVVTQATLAAGGRLELSSSDLGGTRVTLHLPAAAQPRGGAPS